MDLRFCWDIEEDASASKVGGMVCGGGSEIGTTSYLFSLETKFEKEREKIALARVDPEVSSCVSIQAIRFFFHDMFI